ncbi:DUF7305 domain-containing protein [Pseudoalteromonas peptidolytica]|uniref:DUF7305 domain-containing protein n=1 Tax=Pseudoalteromonas peptidolytica F12-50-A1 TaxID=1315280 RepID=A0A8I0MXI6_9GAMM|nr:polymer-forming cytoskeletal protein [Pseudoalteromonas peptidolytica]MBE0347173.1 hypothetical protein [Pseudoalteromonas peptidolytica F12-50-A1]NLR13822.1 polymer-forming cytoskeletal protein [Pseudoalteromonas peptidolytica]GEK10816.1 hypothetical protein PPE03_30650 [Pseudoalteromonas peptidolytica]
MKQQQGFTLVKVMLLGGMASVVVFASLKEGVVQERLSGNFQKDINARLVAEQGIREYRQRLEQSLINNPTSVAQLVAGVSTTGDGAINDSRFNISVTTSGNEFSVESLGQRYGEHANHRLVARFELQPAPKASIFQNAVTGCKGVNLSGSGAVDSYDSSKGTYEETKSNDGDVHTVVGDADVVLSGHSPIKGDVQASGIVYLKGSSPILGDVRSNTGVDISPSSSGIRVEGNVYSRGFFKHRGGKITGYVRAMGDAQMEWGAEILNQQGDAFDIQYAGSGQFKDTGLQLQDGVHYSDPRFRVQDLVVEPVKVYDPDSPDYDPAKPNKECDPLALPFNMNSIIDPNNQYTDLQVGARQILHFKPKQAVYERNGTHVYVAKEKAIYLFQGIDQNLGAATERTQLAFPFKSLKLGSDGQIKVSGGDVIWLVDGDMTLSGNTQIWIEKGSSLTVFTTGKVSIGASAKVVAEQEGLTESGLPVFSVYSSFDEPNGFVFSGASSLYAAIYSPLTTILLNGSGQFYGTVRGASITGTGGTGIHFDQALKNAGIGVQPPSGGKPKLIFKGWHYKPYEVEDQEASN